MPPEPIHCVSSVRCWVRRRQKMLPACFFRNSGVKMPRLTENLDAIADRISAEFAAKDAARERVLPLCREVIRYCSNARRALHRQEMQDAAAINARGGEGFCSRRQTGPYPVVVSW